jgi:hypothetical protein
MRKEYGIRASGQAGETCPSPGHLCTCHIKHILAADVKHILAPQQQYARGARCASGGQMGVGLGCYAEPKQEGSVRPVAKICFMLRPLYGLCDSTHALCAALRLITTSGVHDANGGEDDAANTHDGIHGASTRDGTHNTHSTRFPRRRARDTPRPVVGRQRRVRVRPPPGRDRSVSRDQ